MKGVNKIFLLVFFLSPVMLSAQIILLPQRLNPVSVTLDEMLTFQALNSTASTHIADIRFSGFLEGKGQVFEAFIPSFTFNPGVDGIFMNSSGLRILNPALQQYISKTGYLPPGRYKLCFRFGTRGETFSDKDQCQLHEIILIRPPIPVTPADKSEINEVSPLLTWTPPAPLPGNLKVTYSLLLMEVFDRQSPEEAVIRNYPIFKENGLTENLAIYPQSAPVLEEGKQYAWQVTADIENLYKLKSEVASFKIAVPDTTRKPEKRQVKVYAVPSQHLDANYFVAKGELAFSTENGGSVKDIRIFNSRDKVIATQDDFEIKEAGRDRYAIKINEHRAFRHKQMYRFEIREGERYMKVKFLYLDPGKGQ